MIVYLSKTYIYKLNNIWLVLYISNPFTCSHVLTLSNWPKYSSRDTKKPMNHKSDMWSKLRSQKLIMKSKNVRISIFHYKSSKDPSTNLRECFILPFFSWCDSENFILILQKIN